MCEASRKIYNTKEYKIILYVLLLLLSHFSRV